MVADELELIHSILDEKKGFIYAALYEGSPEQSLPSFLHQVQIVSFTEEPLYFDQLSRMVPKLLGFEENPQVGEILAPLKSLRSDIISDPELVWGVPRNRNQDFVGKSKSLKEIRRILSEGKMGSISHCVVSGFGNYFQYYSVHFHWQEV